MLGWSPTAIKFAALYERLFALICTLDDNGFGSGFGPVKVITPQFPVVRNWGLNNLNYGQEFANRKAKERTLPRLWGYPLGISTAALEEEK
jgi:hypothetical protein